ncbi:MAG: DUF1887 family protein [bacterium]|nr:DUF1887 family protein [bacterium]
MSRVLVSLVSEQPIPNILAIHHFKPDELLFISTQKMENQCKTSSILKTLELLELGDYQKDNKFHKILVQEDSILDCYQRLDEWINKSGKGKEEVEFVVNLTCGTKIMSFAAYEFFRDYNNKMIYVPIAKNEFIVPFPKKSAGQPTALNLRLKVIEYLTAYSLKVLNNKNLDTCRQEAKERKELSKWMVENYNQIENLLHWLYSKLGNHRNKKNFELTDTFDKPTQEERAFLGRFGFSLSNEEGSQRLTISKKLTKSQIRYLTGGWLEEYCFNSLLELHEQGLIDDVQIGLHLEKFHGQEADYGQGQLSRQPGQPEGKSVCRQAAEGQKSNNENEYDCLFTKDNALYFVECKSLPQDKGETKSTLYKIEALQQNFGLKVNSFLVTASSPSEDLAKRFKSEIISLSELGQLKEKIAQKIRAKNSIDLNR